jgi:hypothetical protein
MIRRQSTAAPPDPRHPSGLEIELPNDVYEVETSATGWRIRPLAAVQRRSPFEIHIEIAASARPEGEWPQSRRLHGREIHYRIDNEEDSGIACAAAGGGGARLSAGRLTAQCRAVCRYIDRAGFGVRWRACRAGSRGRTSRCPGGRIADTTPSGC